MHAAKSSQIQPESNRIQSQIKPNPTQIKPNPNPNPNPKPNQIESKSNQNHYRIPIEILGNPNRIIGNPRSQGASLAPLARRGAEPRADSRPRRAPSPAEGSGLSAATSAVQWESQELRRKSQELRRKSQNVLGFTFSQDFLGFLQDFYQISISFCFGSDFDFDFDLILILILILGLDLA